MTNDIGKLTDWGKNNAGRLVRPQKQLQKQPAEKQQATPGGANPQGKTFGRRAQSTSRTEGGRAPSQRSEELKQPPLSTSSVSRIPELASLDLPLTPCHDPSPRQEGNQDNRMGSRQRLPTVTERTYLQLAARHPPPDWAATILSWLRSISSWLYSALTALLRLAVRLTVLLAPLWPILLVLILSAFLEATVCPLSIPGMPTLLHHSPPDSSLSLLPHLDLRGTHCLAADLLSQRRTLQSTPRPRGASLLGLPDEASVHELTSTLLEAWAWENATASRVRELRDKISEVQILRWYAEGIVRGGWWWGVCRPRAVNSLREAQRLSAVLRKEMEADLVLENASSLAGRSHALLLDLAHATRRMCRGMSLKRMLSLPDGDGSLSLSKTGRWRLVAYTDIFSRAVQLCGTLGGVLEEWELCCRLAEGRGGACPLGEMGTGSIGLEMLGMLRAVRFVEGELDRMVGQLEGGWCGWWCRPFWVGRAR